MSTERQKDIYNNYNLIESQDPDISTERLLSMTAEQSGCDISEVVDALFVVGSEKGLVRES